MTVSPVKQIFRGVRGIARNSSHKLRNKINKALEQHVVNISGGVVCSGLFNGLRLDREEIFGAMPAKLLGTYEMELHPILAQLIQQKPGVICNIGAAEGYYAVGFARQENVNRVYTFESTAQGQALVQKNAKLNDVGEIIESRGHCDEATLFQLLDTTSIDLVIMDIEGAELDVLSPRVLSLLKKTDLVIESHDFCRPDCLENLVEMFSATHSLKVIKSTKRRPSDFPTRSILPHAFKLRLLDEGRPEEMSWLTAISNP